jgi:protein-L-isoaspartate(D-aspartate) O-methyltransferase
MPDAPPPDSPDVPLPSSPEDRGFERRRAALVEELREKGLDDARVLAAVARVPRHLFVDTALRARAYRDEALPIGLGQTISQPFTVAYQTSLLGVGRGDRVLEVGTGSGYQAAVLCELGVTVFSVERHAPLAERTQALLERLGYRITARTGDGTQGWPEHAPFDAIVVTAGGLDVPPALLHQLRAPTATRPGGVLVIPVGGAGGQTMQRIVRTGPQHYEMQEHGQFRLVPLVKGD